MKWMKIRNGEPHTCALRITTSEQRVWDFPGGPVVKNPPWISRDSGLIPVWGAKFSHAVEQLSPHGNCWGHTTTRESVCPKERSSLNLSILLKKEKRNWFPLNVWFTGDWDILPMNICQESLPVLRPIRLLGLRLDFPIFALLAH